MIAFTAVPSLAPIIHDRLTLTGRIADAVFPWLAQWAALH